MRSLRYHQDTLFFFFAFFLFVMTVFFQIGFRSHLSYPLKAEKKGPDSLAVSLTQKAGGFSAVSQT